MGDGAGKSIILFADGTGNSASTVFKTNVWRLYEALDLGGDDQIATFADGVGTSSFKPFEVIGLALGFGVKRRVLNLYKFLCLNYEPGDRIFLFGFSRGAFTVRLVAGMLAREGLVEFQSHEELGRNAVAAYRSYRQRAFKGKRIWTKWGRRARDGVVSAWNWLTGSRPYAACRPKSDNARSPEKLKIDFLGVWDTVAAYGLPIDELTRAVNEWVWPLTFENSRLRSTVKCARQALSLDDERRTFFPIPWEAVDDNKQPIGTDRLLQVWFAGVHANVGGGYPDDRLAHIPLCWMIREAAKCGLKFKPHVVRQYKDIASANGRIYDSRANLGVGYRYHPRSVQTLMPRQRPIVDASVVARLVSGPDGYAPISLPHDFRVLAPDGTIHDLFSEEAPSEKPTPGDIQFRKDVADLSTRLEKSGNANARIELVRDTVWWRRANYYASLLLIIVAIAYPFFAEYVASGTLSQLGAGASFAVGWVVGILKLFLPGFVEPWLKAIARSPSGALALIGAIIVSIWLSGFLRMRIADRSRIAWSNENWIKSQYDFEGQMRTSQKRLSSTTVALGVVVGLFALAAGTTTAGLVLLALAAMAFAVRLVTGRTKRLQKVSLLGLARVIRTSKIGQSIYQHLRTSILPFGALIATALLIVVVANKVSVEMASAAGLFCEAAQGEEKQTTEFLGDGTTINFNPKSMCQNTGLTLEKGERYRVTITMTEQWKDDETLSGVVGFPATSFIHKIAVPIRRWWGYAYFQPIARIGNRGSSEKPLEPIRLKKERPEEIKSAQFLFTPDQTGRLYLYLNDAAIGLPGLYGFFYDENNHGSATVKVENVSGY